MELKMYGVGFGEFIRLKDDKTKFVIDCGSKSLKKSPKSKNLFNGGLLTSAIDSSFTIMISHTDEDHYNGYKYYLNEGQKYVKAYLPDISFQGQFFSLKLALLDIALNGNTSKLKSRKLIRICHDILQIVDFSNIVTVSRGDVINEINSRVIWPCSIREDCSDYYSEIADILNNLDDNEKELYNQFLEGILPFFRIVFNYHKHDDSNNNLKIDNYFLDSKEIYEKTLDFLNDYILTYQFINKNVERRLKVQRLFEKTNNVCSIVMNMTSPQKQEILFSGDITQKILIKLNSNGSLKKLYNIVKVPHHGTEKYISSFLPTSNEYIISNGLRKNWGIGFSISLYNNVTCTHGNKNCNFYLKRGYCACSHICRCPIIRII